MPSSSSTNFAGEKFLSERIPDFHVQWRWITLELIIVTIFVIVIVPRIVEAIFASNDAKKADAASRPSSSIPSPTNIQTSKTTSKRKSKRRNESKSNTVNKNVNNNPIQGDTTPNDNTNAIIMPSYVMPIINLLWILSCFAIVANSPNNKYAARAVFQAPLLHPEECSHVISMAEEAAKRNVERATTATTLSDDANNNQTTMLLMDPRGWQKTRHKSYPTTDLNLVTDPFTKDDRDYLRRLLDSRLAPLIERVYGITPSALRANDMFIVRYDPLKGQSALRRHTDSSHVSFNILLSSSFSGGGTRFHNRITSQYIDAHPSPGEVLLNNAMVEHEGLATTNGTRYILVGFLNVATRDAFTGVKTGLSWFASWLCLPWLDVTLNEGLEVRYHQLEDSATTVDSDSDGDGGDGGDGGGGSLMDNRYFRSLVRDVRVAARMIGDIWSPHSFVKLVDEENKRHYLEALDNRAAAVVARQRDDELEKKKGASWFEGQQVSVGLDGMVAAKWESRVNAGDDSFKDDL